MASRATLLKLCGAVFESGIRISNRKIINKMGQSEASIGLQI